MGFSIVHLRVPITALTSRRHAGSTAVVAVAPIVNSSTNAPEFDWSMTTLGDPTNNAQGVVRYLATQATPALSGYVDAIAVDAKGHVVAVLSSRHFWYPATFVAQVADVVATGRGCHADLGISGTNEQGGGVLITKIKALQRSGARGLEGWRRDNQLERNRPQHLESARLHAVPDAGLHHGARHLRPQDHRAARDRDAGVSL